VTKIPGKIRRTFVRIDRSSGLRASWLVRIDKMKISEAVRGLRKQLNLTQAKFARQLNLTAASVAHFETGVRVPDAGSLLLFCRAAFKDARRIDLADVFADALPGVKEGLLIPCWRSGDRKPLPYEPPSKPLLYEPLKEQVVSVRVIEGYEPDQPQRSRARRFRRRPGS
jgi:transcriptional regulator with XRE-family HTH domain